MLKENLYKESFISKIIKRITDSIVQSQQQMQATDIQEDEVKMSIDLPCVEGGSEKLRCIQRSHKIRFNSYVGNTF